MNMPAARCWWERPDLRYEDGRLHLAGQDVARLAEAAQAPLYLYALDRAEANLARVGAALAATGCDSRLFYAMKANRFAPLLGRFAASGGCGVDICSPDELDLALVCGFAPDRISFTGTAVSPRDLDRLLRQPILINCDTIGMIRRIGERAPGRDIGIRVNPGRGTGGSDLLTYAGATTTKFGIYREQWAEALAVARGFGLRVTAMHFHVGCGYLDSELTAWDEAIAAACDFIADLPDLALVNVGGGLGLPHRPDERALDLARWSTILARHFAGRGLTIAAEPGDYVVKDAGLLVLSVTDVERKRDTRFVYVDGGFNLHPEPVHYQLPCEPVACVPRPGPAQTVTIAGNINEALDIWGVGIAFPPVAEGDCVALLNAGGYGAAMSSNHCMRGTFVEQAV
jgi:diaminopimelate decarboxylase